MHSWYEPHPTYCGIVLTDDLHVHDFDAPCVQVFPYRPLKSFKHGPAPYNTRNGRTRPHNFISLSHNVIQRCHKMALAHTPHGSFHISGYETKKSTLSHTGAPQIKQYQLRDIITHCVPPTISQTSNKM